MFQTGLVFKDGKVISHRSHRKIFLNPILRKLFGKAIHMGCPNMTGVKEEDLGIFAPRALDDFYEHNHPALSEALGIGSEPDSITRMMAVLPYVAEHYNLDRNDLLQNWTSEFGLMRMMNGS